MKAPGRAPGALGRPDVPWGVPGPPRAWDRWPSGDAPEPARPDGGSYPAPGPELLQIVPGFSKEHRPDLCQVGLGLVSNPEGSPLLADVHDGNLSDNTWNGTIIAELARVLPEQTLRAILYTADCKLVTPNNLRALHDAGLHWLNRLPEAYDLAATRKQRACVGGSWDASAPPTTASASSRTRPSAPTPRIPWPICAIAASSCTPRPCRPVPWPANAG